MPSFPALLHSAFPDESQSPSHRVDATASNPARGGYSLLCRLHCAVFYRGRVNHHCESEQQPRYGWCGHSLLATDTYIFCTCLCKPLSLCWRGCWSLWRACQSDLRGTWSLSRRSTRCRRADRKAGRASRPGRRRFALRWAGVRRCQHPRGHARCRDATEPVADWRPGTWPTPAWATVLHCQCPQSRAGHPPWPPSSAVWGHRLRCAAHRCWRGDRPL
mmetsp:Transcript_18907/g.48076  ORF Transcript_18907/g.48076 Transcript_18907/m.48076 type:complete len:218 (+) Transcript_18907:776-1429(+)